MAPPLVLATLGGLALARGHGFWYDEVYTSEMVQLPLGRLWRAFVRGEGTIPYLLDAPPSYNAPYYATAHLWLAITRLRADEFGLRLLSLLAAVAAVGVFTRAVGRLAAGRRVGAAAGLFVAVNPFVVQYAVEARGYALALLATSTGALGVARWLDDGSRRSLVLYGGASAAAGLFHWYALLIPGALAVAVVALRGRRAGPVLAVTALATLPASTVAGVAVANGVGASGAEWLRGVGAGVPRLFLQSWSGRNGALLVATLATVALGLMGRDRLRRPALIVAACWVAVPLALVTAAELGRPVFVDRYLLSASLGLALLMALGAVRRPAAVGATLTMAVLAVSLMATAAELRRPPKDDVRGAVDEVAARHLPGQPVVAAGRWDALGVDHYVGRDHPDLRADLVLPPAPVPTSPTVWVVRRLGEGVKGDGLKLAALDRELTGRGLAPVAEVRFDGRYADVLVQRWEVGGRPA